MIGTRELHEPGGVRGGAARTTGHSLLFVHRRHAHGNARGDEVYCLSEQECRRR